MDGTLELLDTLTLERLEEAQSYDLITPARMHELQHLSTGRPVLSLYLDNTPERSQREPLALRLRHLAEATRESIGDREERLLFDAVIGDVNQRLQELGRQLAGGGLVLFAAPERFTPKGEKPVAYAHFYAFRLPEPPADVLEWGPRPALLPLLIQMDEHAPTGIVLVDRQRARFFVADMGLVTEYSVAEYDPTPPETKALGWGAHNHEQWLAEQYERHLKHVARFVDAIHRQEQWKWLVIGGVGEAPQALVDVLPERLQEKTIGVFQMDVDATPNQVNEAVAPIVHQAEVQEERATLERWIGELERVSHRAVAGWADTTLALQQGRIDTLILPVNGIQTGWQCMDCGGLVADILAFPPERCPYCSGELVEVPDVAALAAEQVLTHKGHIEVVRDEENRALLEQYGVVGALLRF